MLIPKIIPLIIPISHILQVIFPCGMYFAISYVFMSLSLFELLCKINFYHVILFYSPMKLPDTL